MVTKKTAISIQEPLLAEIEALAEEMHISKSRLFSLAAREYIDGYKSTQLLDELNAVYQTDTDHSEQTIRDAMKRKHYQTVKGQW